MDGCHQLVLVAGRLVALALEHGLAQILQARLILALADVDTVDGNIGTGGHTLDILLLTVHGTLDAIVIALAEQIDAVVTGAAPNGVFGLRINPHRLLRKVEASLVNVAEHADGSTLTSFKLGVSDFVGTVGEHHGGEQQAKHDGEDHGRDPSDHRPLEHDAKHHEHNDWRHEHAAAQPRKSLIFGVGVLEDLNDLLDGALLLLWLFFVCHRFPHLVMRLLTLER